jgi:hypothetical protein
MESFMELSRPAGIRETNASCAVRDSRRRANYLLVVSAPTTSRNNTNQLIRRRSARLTRSLLLRGLEFGVHPRDEPSNDRRWANDPSL